MSLKYNIKQWEHSNNRVKRLICFITRSVWRCAWCLIEPERRSQLITGLLYPKIFLQRSVYTFENRYPDLFRECAERMAGTVEPMILSYGCATGAEVISLSKWLPNAKIVGVDINTWCLRQCRRRLASTKYRFIHRASTDFHSVSEFDAVFCLAVFQRAENRTSIDNSKAQGISFQQFESELLLLDEKLKAGGLLFIDHSDFDFLDTRLCARYQPLGFSTNRVQHERPLFDRQNCKLAERQDLFRGFVKVRS